MFFVEERLVVEIREHKGLATPTFPSMGKLESRSDGEMG
jgi:hypothetical protein